MEIRGLGARYVRHPVELPILWGSLDRTEHKAEALMRILHACRHPPRPVMVMFGTKESEGPAEALHKSCWAAQLCRLASAPLSPPRGAESEWRLDGMLEIKVLVINVLTKTSNSPAESFKAAEDR